MPRLKKEFLNKTEHPSPKKIITYFCSKILRIFTIQMCIYLILRYIQPEHAQSHYLGMNDSTCSGCCRCCWLLLVMKSGKLFILSVTIHGLITVRVLSLQYLEQYQNYYD